MNWWEAITLGLIISLHADASRAMADRWEKKGRLGLSIFVLCGALLERFSSMGVFAYGGYLLFITSAS